jgi:hypothetical protein
MVMDDKKTSRYKKFRDWSYFLAVFPFGFLFFMGCMSLKTTIPILFNFNNYKYSKIEVIEIKDVFSDPVSYIGTGYIDGEKKDVYLGAYGEYGVSEIIKEFSESGNILKLDVLYSTSTDKVLFEKNKTKEQVKKKYLMSSVRSLVFFEAPFLLCLIIGFVNHKKIKAHKV